MQAPAFSADGLLSTRYRRLERLWTRTQRNIVETIGKTLPLGISDFARPELGECAVRHAAKGVGVDVVQRHTNDAAARNIASGGEMEEPWQQLASRQVTSGAEKHHHLRETRT